MGKVGARCVAEVSVLERRRIVCFVAAYRGECPENSVVYRRLIRLAQAHGEVIVPASTIVL